MSKKKFVPTEEDKVKAKRIMKGVESNCYGNHKAEEDAEYELNK